MIHWRGGWASIDRWVMGASQYLARATSENIENHEPGERMMRHQSIRQNSKHSWEALNSLLLDAKSFLDDIDWMRPQRMCPTTWLGTYVIKKLKLYDECCDQLLSSGEPNSAYIGILSTGGLKNRWWGYVALLQRPSFCLMLPAMLSGVQHWTQKVPELWYFINFSIHLRYFVIINMIKLFLFD